MTTNVTLSNRRDVLAAVPRVLGFMPDDSLVILSTGGGPAARVDMPHSEEQVLALCDALMGALPHWRHHPCLIVGYTADAEIFDTLDLARLLPGVQVPDSFRVAEGFIFDRGDAVGERYIATPDLPGLSDLPEPQVCREALVAEAQRFTEAEHAAQAAWRAYRSGDGARAWCFHDRAVALGGATGDLADRLSNAVPPRSA